MHFKRLKSPTLLLKVTLSMPWTTFFVRRAFKIKREHGRKNYFAVVPTQEVLTKRLTHCQIKMIPRSR